MIMYDDKLLNQIQVCNLLQISYSTLIRYRAEEDFPKPRLLNKKELLFSKNEIEM